MNFFITIDTEGDNQWSPDNSITTHNLREVPKFQELVESFDFVSTYFCNYEAMCDETFAICLSEWLKTGSAELGMHIHSWTSPPFHNKRPLNYQSFLIEESKDMMRKKVRLHKDLAESTFNRRVVAHRAGRWALNSLYAQILIEEGIYIDSSITPGVNWKAINSQYAKNEIDYSNFKNSLYIFRDHSLFTLGENALSRNDLLEMPMSIWQRYEKKYELKKIPRSVLNRLYPDLLWVRLMPGNKKRVIQAMTELVKNGAPYVMFMLHSSELLESANPYFKNKKEVERFFQDIKEVFHHASLLGLNGSTLEAYREQLIGE